MPAYTPTYAHIHVPAYTHTCAHMIDIHRSIDIAGRARAVEQVLADADLAPYQEVSSFASAVVAGTATSSASASSSPPPSSPRLRMEKETLVDVHKECVKSYTLYVQVPSTKVDQIQWNIYIYSIISFISPNTLSCIPRLHMFLYVHLDMCMLSTRSRGQ